MTRARAKNAVIRLLREQASGEQPPIDVDEVARLLGIEVVSRPSLEVGGREASGILLRTGGRTICVLNANDHYNRRRFTLAHEIGHYVLHPPRESYIDRTYARNERSSEGVDRHEIEANAFAAELLMPEQLIKAHAPQRLNVIEHDDEIRELARLFKVSPQAMTLRLANLGLLRDF